MEFRLIERIRELTAQPRDDVRLGIGDDAAVLAVPRDRSWRWRSTPWSMACIFRAARRRRYRLEGAGSESVRSRRDGRESGMGIAGADAADGRSPLSSKALPKVLPSWRSRTGSPWLVATPRADRCASAWPCMASCRRARRLREPVRAWAMRCWSPARWAMPPPGLHALQHPWRDDDPRSSLREFLIERLNRPDATTGCRRRVARAGECLRRHLRWPARRSRPYLHGQWCRCGNRGGAAAAFVGIAWPVRRDAARCTSRSAVAMTTNCASRYRRSGWPTCRRIFPGSAVA